MARPQPTIPVSARMYRHFAVATLSITACLAMFADGESREALADQVSRADMRQAEGKLAEQGKGGNSALTFTDKRRNKGSFGADGGGDEGGGSGGDGTLNGASIAAAQDGPGEAPVYAEDSAAQAPAEMPQMLQPGMSAAEYQQMKAGPRKPGRPAASQRPTQAQVDGLMAASAARSRTRTD